MRIAIGALAFIIFSIFMTIVIVYFDFPSLGNAGEILAISISTIVGFLIGLFMTE